jgi:anthranilate synthase/aminodeoxychorismate synthase-like glutamine amidotransferase
MNLVTLTLLSLALGYAVFQRAGVAPSDWNLCLAAIGVVGVVHFLVPRRLRLPTPDRIVVDLDFRGPQAVGPPLSAREMASNCICPMESVAAVWRPAVGFAESPPVRDLPDAAGSRVNVDVRERERETADKKDRSGVAAADPDGEEINEQNRERLRDVDVTAPGTPDGAGVSMKAIEYFAGRIPVLGVCLGHQAIGQVFGGRVVRAPQLFHGKSSAVQHDGKTIFSGLDQSFSAGRYHSLIVEDQTLPSCLEVSARTSDGIIMGLRHRELKVEGVQFHPESIMTTAGKDLLANFLKL